MSRRPTLEEKLTDLANRFRFSGISLTSLGGIAFLFSPREAGWPLAPFPFCLGLIFAIGCTLLVCGQLVVRKLVGFGSIEPPPIVAPTLKD